MREPDQSRTKELFLDALELAGPERGAFLEAACAGHTTLRARVDALLDAHARSAAMDELVARDTPPEPDPPLALVGDYELLEVLGRGAFGTVYLARQTSLGREVALKVLRAGSFASENEVRRFRREAEAAAALDHPSIVPVFDIGEVDDHHYFSMKRVEGESLDQAVERFVSDPHGAARLIATVARAVHHAHCRGVLHRDLKPSNILLDEHGDAYVADFGIALPLGAARITQTGLISGTPTYMSPEQARGESDVTVATDVWSLGCVLHELLTGAAPFGGGTVPEVLRRVQEDDPPRPPGVARDLATIIAACLAKEPARRYPTALALAEDLERWQTRRPITARPTTRLERLRLLCRRSPVAASLGLTVALLIALLGVGAVAASLVLGRQLKDTRAALRDTLVANARAERRSELAGRREVGLDLLGQAAAIAPGPDLRDEAITTLTLPDLRSLGSWGVGSGAPIGADDRLERVALAFADGRVQLRDAADGAVQLALPAGAGPARGALFSADGQRLWLRRGSAGAQRPARLEVWRLAAEAPQLVHERDESVTFFARSADGRYVGLVRGADGEVEVLDAHDFSTVVRLEGGEQPARCAFRPDAGALAVSTGDGRSIEVYAAPSGAPLASLQLPDLVAAVAWSPDGASLIAGCHDQRAYIWRTADWQLSTVLRGHEAEVIDVALLPGRIAATNGWDGTARFWDLDAEVELLRSSNDFLRFSADGRRAVMNSADSVLLKELVVHDFLRTQHVHQGKAPREVVESADGRYLATCGEASWVLWDVATGTRVHSVPTDVVHSVVFEPGGDVLTIGDGGVLRWPLERGTIGEPERLLAGECLRGAVSPDGRWIGVVRAGRALLLGPDGVQRELGRHRGLDRVAFSADGAWVAVGSWAGAGLRIWSTATGALAAHLDPEAPSAMATFSPDGRWLVVATYEHVRVHRTRDWALEREFARLDPRRPSVPAAFSADGRLLAVGIGPGRVRLVLVEDWSTLAELEPSVPRSLFHLCFADGGRRLLAATPSQRLLTWNLDALWSELSQRGLAIDAEPPWRATR